MKTKQVYLHDSTYATPFSLLLWGARVRHERPRKQTKKEAVEVVIGERLRAVAGDDFSKLPCNEMYTC